MTPPRGLVLFTGAPERTAALAQDRVAALPTSAVLWISEHPHPLFASTTARGARAWLGAGLAAVVLDLHDGLHADTLALAQGFVAASGCLVLRLADAPAPDPRLAVDGMAVDAVGVRLQRRLRAQLAGLDLGRPQLAPAPAGTPKQRALVTALTQSLGSPAVHVVLAARGRGKSTALGLFARTAADRGARVTVVAPSERAARALLDAADGRCGGCLPPSALARPLATDVLLIDEAAQIPVPLLRRAILLHPDRAIVLATTTEGYEGTGRGFALRLLPWLRALPRPVHEHALVTPIRYAADDPVERAVHRALMLDAPPPASATLAAEPRHAVLSQDRLAADEHLARQVFGLLVHAHYRTTPADLHRLLDAPNLVLHALLDGERPVAVNLIAREGALPAEAGRAIAAGHLRPRGHVLPDTLASHCGDALAVTRAMIRSVRIAVHPGLRGRGFGARLAREVLAAEPSALHGTVCSATPEILRFRRRLGYRLVRIGAARGPRTGEPAIVMLRPGTIEDERRVERLARALARDLPTQLALLRAEDPLLADPELDRALREDLPEPLPWTLDEARATLARYCAGPLHFEGAASAIRWLLGTGHPVTDDPAARQLLHALLAEARGWAQASAEAGFPSVPAAQRSLKRAISLT